MANIRIKVCGMRDNQNIMDVAAMKPDFMGFIFYPGTPRFVGENFTIPENFPAEIQRVGVFVNETTDEILKKVEVFQLSFVQLHGGETAAQCRELKKHIGIIKVFSVDDDMDFRATNAFADEVDYFLFDTKGKLYGGNAKRFNWDMLAQYDQRVPFFLSGGIGPEHLKEVEGLAGLNIVAIDVNSGVEVQPGYKDVNKIRAIKAMLNNNE